MQRLGLIVTCVLAASPAHAAEDVAGAARQVVSDLLEAAVAKAARTPVKVMLLPLQQTRQDAVGHDYQAAFMKAVVDSPKVKVIEQKGLEAALKEHQLAALGAGAPADTLAEIAGAFGAELWIAGSLDRLGGTYRANARAIAAGTGAVVATAGVSFNEPGKQDAVGGRLDAQLRMLADQIAGGLDQLDGAARYQRFAILPFAEMGGSTSDKQLGTLIAAELSTLLRRDHGLMLVEREQVARIMDELALGQTGIVAPEHTIEVGHLSGADALVLGTVSEAGASYLVNGRVVSTKSGDVVLAERVKLPAGDLIALSSEAVVLRSKSGAFFRSLLVPGWGQFYNRDPIKGGIFTGAVVLGAGAAIALHLRGQGLERQYDDLPAGSAEFESKAARASDAYRTRNYVMLGVAAIHLFNIVDAVLNGYSAASPDPS